MKKSALSILAILLMALHSSSALQLNEGTQLTIYTYDSLLAYPGYDYIGNFSAYAGVPRDSINLVTFSDATEILTRSAVEKDSPQADVLIGLDNGLVHKARSEEILQPYVPSTIANIPQELINGLANDNLLTPYDYGVISLYYDKNRVGDLGNFTLSDLTDKQLANKLVLENPLLSSPGLGFLLWTNAELGSQSPEWNALWTNIRDNGRLVDSWGDAYNVFAAKESDRPIMVSYTSSPAFDKCLYNDSSTAALLTTGESGKVRGWEQIEGIGLVKNAQHKALAKQFIDWFIDSNVQDNIYLNQWMYPAMSGISIPACYNSSTYTPEDIIPYNSELTPQDITQNLDKWLNSWEELYVINTNTTPLPTWVFMFGLAIFVVVRKKYSE